MNPRFANSTHASDAFMIDQWAARDLGKIPDVSQTRADLLNTTRQRIKDALALPLAPALPALPAPGVARS